LLLLLLVSWTVEAKIWNAQELAVGEWDVTLRGGWFFDPAKIFPKTSLRSPGNQDFSVRRHLWGSSMDCSLSVCEDGTFVMTPANASGSSASSIPRKSLRLDLRGNWKVFSNPYCITDRFYDQLTLRSFPRRAISSSSRSSNVILDLSCRMWGRHVNSKRLGRKGLMTHGTLVWKESKKSRFPPRRIVASFSAKRVSIEPSHVGWEDVEFFGY